MAPKDGVKSNPQVRAADVQPTWKTSFHIQEINKDILIDLHSWLTNQAENLDVVADYFKNEFPTVLNSSRNLGDSVCESMKRLTN